jgi:uncharacterized FAD-dependent dehydrogenase
MEQKPFAVGLRIEHLRREIDSARYGAFASHPALGAADYKLVWNGKDGKGVYSFCMCPGGVVVCAASEEGLLCVNGMSLHARDGVNSNAALLVGLDPAMEGDHPLAGIAMQRRMERAAFLAGGGDYTAPAQLVGDFLANRPSSGFGAVRPSCTTGAVPGDVAALLPSFVAARIREALPALGRMLRGFDLPEAVLTAPESRSSSPVRLPRDKIGQSPLRGLFPCGEGAGFAGGILSAAVDGHTRASLFCAPAA